MHIHCALVNFDTHAPDSIQQLRACINTTGFFHQLFQEAEFRWPQMDFTARAMHAPAGAIKDNIPHTQLIRDTLRAGAAQKRADAGDIVDAEAVRVGPEETAFEAMGKVVGATRLILERQIDALLAGAAPQMPQNEADATYFGGRTPEDGRIDWTWPASRIVNLVRAVAAPFPGAFSDGAGGRLFVWRARKAAGTSEPGTVVTSAPLVVACGDGAVEILEASLGEGATVAGAALGLAAGARIG